MTCFVPVGSQLYKNIFSARSSPAEWVQDSMKFLCFNIVLSVGDFLVAFCFILVNFNAAMHVDRILQQTVQDSLFLLFYNSGCVSCEVVKLHMSTVQTYLGSLYCDQLINGSLCSSTILHVQYINYFFGDIFTSSHATILLHQSLKPGQTGLILLCCIQFVYTC